MPRKIKEVKSLSEEEKQELIRNIQKNCKHDQGYITNTTGPSKCKLCGKPWN